MNRTTLIIILLVWVVGLYIIAQNPQPEPPSQQAVERTPLPEPTAKEVARARLVGRPDIIVFSSETKEHIIFFSTTGGITVVKK